MIFEVEVNLRDEIQTVTGDCKMKKIDTSFDHAFGTKTDHIWEISSVVCDNLELDSDEEEIVSDAIAEKYGD